jgi:hypothetical protein
MHSIKNAAQGCSIRLKKILHRIDLNKKNDVIQQIKIS